MIVLVLGKSGIHSEISWGNDAAFYVSPLFMESIESSDQDRKWDTEELWDYEYTTGPPVVNIRAFFSDLKLLMECCRTII